MEQNETVGIARASVAIGFREGFKQAIEAIKRLAEQADSPEARKTAVLMAKLLDDFANDALTAFMEEVKFNDIFDIIRGESPGTTQ
jgi:hypothetical protein